MYHRIASFLLGCWILGSLFMIFVATENFKIADAVQDTHTRQFARVLAGQENQTFFVTWEQTQIALNVALTVLLFFGVGSRWLSGLAAALLLITVFQHFWVTPEMIALSVQLDTAALANRFATLHATYGILEVAKLLIALIITGVLLPDWRRQRRTATSSSRSTILVDHLQPRSAKPPTVQ